MNFLKKLYTFATIVFLTLVLVDLKIKLPINNQLLKNDNSEIMCIIMTSEKTFIQRSITGKSSNMFLLISV
jgi:hypothetical protein